MKGRVVIENAELIKFLKPDFSTIIKPGFGLGGFNFNQNIKDFELNWTISLFEKENISDLSFKLDEEYFYLTINSKNREIELEIDLFSGKINSMSCGKGYRGKLENGIGIGSSIKEALKKDRRLGFNPDTDWICRYPFDGLIIYVPNELQTQFMANVISDTEISDFKIDRIEIIDLDFAKKLYDGGELLF